MANLDSVIAKMQGGGVSKSQIEKWLKAGFNYYHDYQPSPSLLDQMKQAADKKIKTEKQKYVALARKYAQNDQIAAEEAKLLMEEHEIKLQELKSKQAAMQAVQSIDSKPQGKVEGTRTVRRPKLVNARSLALHVAENHLYDENGQLAVHVAERNVYDENGQLAQWLQAAITVATKGKTGQDIPGILWEEKQIYNG